MCEKGHFFQKPNLAEGESIEELDGGFFVLQKRGLYRFTSDAIALSRFASAKKGEVIADLCSGSGVVSLNFCALHGGVVKRADLYEIQPELAALSERSVALSGLGGRFFVHNVSIADIGDAERGKFSLVLCNPPYEKAGSGEKSGLPTRSPATKRPLRSRRSLAFRQRYSSSADGLPSATARRGWPNFSI